MSTESRSQFTPSAAVAAWVFPGLGHILIGERKRGWLIMAGVLWMFLGGVLIGGVDAVDRRDDKLWFLAQALCGPIAFVVDQVNQSVVKPMPNLRAKPGSADAQRWRMKGLGHVNEMGTLFAALAGLMNLVVILDALARPVTSEGEGGSGGGSGGEA